MMRLASAAIENEVKEIPIGLEQKTKKIIIKVNLRMELKTPFEKIDRATKDLNRQFRCPWRCSMRFIL